MGKSFTVFKWTSHMLRFFFFLIIEPMFIDYLLSDGHSDVIGVTIANKTMGVPIVPQR